MSAASRQERALERAGATVARHLDAHGPELDVDRGWRRVRADARRPHRPRARWLVAAVVPLLALSLWLAVGGGQRHEALTYVVEHATLRFSDGTEIAIAERAQARVVRIDEHGADIALDRGSVLAHVSPRDGARWRVAAGPFTVRVTGTKFTASWDADEEVFALRMHEGSVELSGPVVGDARAVVAPETITVRPRQGELVVGPVASEAPARAAATETDGARDDPASSPASAEATPVAAASSADVEQQPDAWRALLAAGKRDEALQALRARGVDAVLATESSAGLLQLAQSARLAGDTDLASRAMASLQRRFPKSVEAATAVFLAGRMHFDSGRHAQAVDALRRYLARSPGGAFSREASALLIFALQASGDTAQARTLARDYLDRHPDDAHAARMRQVLAP